MNATAETSNIAAAPGTAPAQIGRPSYREILEGARREEAEAAAAAQRAAADARVEASNARVAQLAVLREKLTEELQDYEILRAQIRATFGRAWHIEQLISQVSNGQVQAMPLGLYEGHLPPAFPGPKDEVFPLFRSFKSDVQHAMAHKGEWPTK